MRNRTKRLVPIVLLLATQGCGPGTFLLAAKYPTEPMTLEPDRGLKVIVKEVTDGRAFETELSQLAAPTYLGQEPLDGLKPRVIGVKGSVGEFTNIYLEEGQSVESIIGDLLEVSFRQAGYRLAEDEADADIVVTATLQQFWIWMTPDAMTIRIESSIQANVTVTWKDGQSMIDAAGYHDSRDVSKSPESYRFALNEGLFDFYTDLSTKCLTLSTVPD